MFSSPMLSTASSPFIRQMEHPAIFGGMSVPAFPVDLGASANVHFHSLTSPMSFLAGNDTVQRRSSRPSSMLSCDSLLAVRLQQEELWKPAKAKHQKPIPNYSVFSAHASLSDAAPVLHNSAGPGIKPKQKSSTHLPPLEPVVDCSDLSRHSFQNKVSFQRPRPSVAQKPVLQRRKYVKRGPKVTSSSPLLSQSLTTRRKPRNGHQNCPALPTVSGKPVCSQRKNVYHERYFVLISK